MDLADVLQCCYDAKVLCSAERAMRAMQSRFLSCPPRMGAQGSRKTLLMVPNTVRSKCAVPKYLINRKPARPGVGRRSKARCWHGANMSDLGGAPIGAGFQT